MSESEEMYLVSIARLKEKGEESPIPLSLLATELSVMPVSANQMIRKLEEAGWVCYTPYRGVDLTDQGSRIASQVLRRRRLWEVFLVENLKISASEASELACRLEHVLPANAAERMASFLGNPVSSPQGLPIPAPQEMLPSTDLPLSALELDETAEITRIEADPAGRGFLKSEGIQPGVGIQVSAVSSSGALLVKTSTGNSVHLSGSLARMLWVQRKTPAESM